MPVFKPELNTSYDLALKYRTGIDRQSRQLVAAIEAAKAAEDFARSINFDLRLTSEDVRAMAISGFIEQSRRAA